MGEFEYYVSSDWLLKTVARNLSHRFRNWFSPGDPFTLVTGKHFSLVNIKAFFTSSHQSTFHLFTSKHVSLTHIKAYFPYSHQSMFPLFTSKHFHLLTSNTFHLFTSKHFSLVHIKALFTSSHHVFRPLVVNACPSVTSKTKCEPGLTRHASNQGSMHSSAQFSRYGLLPRVAFTRMNAALKSHLFCKY